jgi:rare lipoprotein A
MRHTIISLSLAAAVLSVFVAQAADVGTKDARRKVDTGPHAPTVVTKGKGSFYADKFHGKTTATGEKMDQNALTAASKELPLGTRAEVTNLETGKTVEVEINDRGPFVPGRVIDLSQRAAEEVDLDKKDGVAPVKVEAKPGDQPTPELKQKIAEKAQRKRSAQNKANTPARRTPPINGGGD